MILWSVALLTTPAAAANWDYIYTDHMDVTLCTNGCGITLDGTGYALLVNKGATDITGPELFGASYSVHSSEPSISMVVFLNNPGQPVAPIHPNEAVGSVSPYDNDSVLLTKLLPGETFRNTYDWQVFAFEISRLSGSYAGPVRFDVVMNMGGESAAFTMYADVHVGDFNLNFLSAARVTGSQPTAAANMSWGRLKQLYR